LFWAALSSRTSRRTSQSLQAGNATRRSSIPIPRLAELAPHLDGWGYSPLKQIDTRNVKQLQLAWSWGLKPGLSQPNPLVANGMMYVPSPGGGVQTLDAATGDLLWEFSPKDRVAIPCARQ
jgi:glucose dehydrogenase